MKNFFKCKSILAFIICLTMTLGLAGTVCAVSTPGCYGCKAQYGYAVPMTADTVAYVTCNNCRTIVRHEVFKCSQNSSHSKTKVCMNCGTRSNY